jgi:hypothetical protein
MKINMTDTLPLGDRVALAAAITSIRSLPSLLQQYSNSCDMIAMLKDGPAACRRAGYILGQAHAIFESYCSCDFDEVLADEKTAPQILPMLEEFIQRTLLAYDKPEA